MSIANIILVVTPNIYLYMREIGNSSKCDASLSLINCPSDDADRKKILVGTGIYKKKLILLHKNHRKIDQKFQEWIFENC